MTMKLSNIRKKIRELSNVAKVQSHVMLIVSNVMMEWSNVREKNKDTTKYDKSMVKCGVDTI